MDQPVHPEHAKQVIARITRFIEGVENRTRGLSPAESSRHADLVALRDLAAEALELRDAYDKEIASKTMWQDRYMRDVEGLNNEGDPIGGDPPCGMRHTIEILKAQVVEARTYAEQVLGELKTQRTLTCAFCGQQYPPGTPVSQHELLTAHVKVCPKHPMRQLEQDVSEAQADVDRLVRELDVALNGEAGAAKQARLCDVVSQVKDQRWKLVRA